MPRYWDPRVAAAIYAEAQRRADAATAPRRPPRNYAAFEDLAEYAPNVYIAMGDARRPLELPPARRAFYRS